MAKQGETSVEKYLVKVFDYDGAPDAEALYFIKERRAFASQAEAETYAEEAVRFYTDAEIWHQGKKVRHFCFS